MSGSPNSEKKLSPGKRENPARKSGQATASRDLGHLLEAKIQDLEGAASGADGGGRGGGGGGGKAKAKAATASTTSAVVEADSSSSSSSSSSTGELSKRLATKVKEALALDGSDGDKLKFLRSALTEQIQDTRKLEREVVVVRRRAQQAAASEEKALGDLKQANAMRDKLEMLCRELQKQNRTVLEESKRVAQEEHEKRQQLSDKFQSTIEEVSKKMENDSGEKLDLIKDNEGLREKMVSFLKQYELQQEHHAQQIKTKDLEQQLSTAQHAHEVQTLKVELAKAAEYKAQATQSLTAEVELRKQLASYAEKFDSFQDTLGKSNEVFAQFKADIKAQKKENQTLRKETLALRTKGADMDAAFIKATEDNAAQRAELEAAAKKLDGLQKLCRTVTAERSELLKEKERMTAELQAAKGEA